MLGPITPEAAGGPDPEDGLDFGDAERHKMMQRIIAALGELRR